MRRSWVQGMLITMKCVVAGTATPPVTCLMCAVLDHHPGLLWLVR